MIAVAPLRVWAAAACVAVALAVAVAAPRPAPTQTSFNLDQTVPARFGSWTLDPSVVPVKPTPDVQAKLDEIYEQVLSRTYVDHAGHRVMLTITYGGDQRDALQTHLQEVCYQAQGFKIADLRQEAVRIGTREVPATRMVATLHSRTEPVTYWTTMGQRVVRDRGERLLVQIESGLRDGEIPDGMLVRVSNLSSEPAEAFALHERFLSELLAVMTPAAAEKFTGRRG